MGDPLLDPHSVQLNPDNICEAFLDWLSRLPIIKEQFGPQRPTTDALTDGRIIWRVCQDLDSEYFSGELPEEPLNDGRWLSRWQNLKHVYRALDRYFVENDVPIPADARRIDLKGLAERGAKEEILKLLMMVLTLTLREGPHQSRYITAMSSMGAVHGNVFWALIMQIQAEEPQSTIPIDDSDYRNESQDDHTARPPQRAHKPEIDNGLRMEELEIQNARLAREKREIQDDKVELAERLERVQENHEILQHKLTDAEDKIRQLSGGPDHRSRIAELEEASYQQQDLIAEKETQLQKLQNEIIALNGTVHKFRNADERLQALQDEVDELKATNRTLSGKANTANKYLSKIQELQKTTQDNDELRQKVEDLERQLETRSGTAGERVLKLELQISEYEGLLGSIETELAESQMIRRNTEARAHGLEEELEASQQQHARDQETIRELTSADDLRSPRGSLGGDLENELNGERKRDVEIESFQAKVRALEAARDDSNARLLAETRERARAEASFERLKSGAGLEGAEQVRLEELEREKAAFTRNTEYIEKLGDNATANPHATDANGSQVAMVGKGDLDALEALRELSRKELDDKQKELLDAKNMISGLQADLDLAKSRHREAINNQNSDGVGKELRETLEAIKINLPGAPGPTNAPTLSAMFENHVQELVTSLEDSRQRLAERSKHIETQDHEIMTLKQHIASANEKAAPELRSAADQAIVRQERDNLKNETKLIATAFYDLQNRLQMNNVSLQRRTEQPKSFLNKQRLLVNQATAVRTR